MAIARATVFSVGAEVVREVLHPGKVGARSPLAGADAGTKGGGDLQVAPCLTRQRIAPLGYLPKHMLTSGTTLETIDMPKLISARSSQLDAPLAPEEVAPPDGVHRSCRATRSFIAEAPRAATAFVARKYRLSNDGG